jgi:small subunit ribosomal protein S4
MARYNGPKQRLQRRIGEDLGLKTNSLKTARRLSIKPGQHGAKRRRKPSDYSIQLKEKQKIKYMYGILERQLRKLFEKASTNPTATGVALLVLLERRLDNAVYRLGFAPTRAAARQLVSHNHVLVNKKKMNIPSYQVKVGDMIELKSKARNIPAIKDIMEDESVRVPKWLDKKGYIGKIKSLPERENIDQHINEQLIVEFFNR